MYAAVAYIIAALVAGYGAYQQSATNEEVADYQSKVAENNQITTERAAEDTRRKGMQAASEHLQQVRLLKGRQTAALASKGLSLDSGSPMEILESTDFFGKVDAERIANNAYGQAHVKMAEARGLAGEAAMYRARGNAESPMGEAGISLIGSAGTYAGNSMKAK